MVGFGIKGDAPRRADAPQLLDDAVEGRITVLSV